MNMSKQTYRPVPVPLKVHGGKGADQGKSAKWIAGVMPPHRNYVEPFAGGLAVLLVKDPDGVNEIVNDLNGDLTNFWRVLKHPDDFQRFRRVVEAVPFSEREWNDAREWLDRHPDGDPVERAVRFFIFNRQSLAGRMRGFATLSTGRTRRGMNEQVSAWQTAVKGLPAVHNRLWRVAILNRPALEVIRQYDRHDVVFYCDPPYPHETRVARQVYGAFEMSTADHAELLAVLRGCKGKVLLSGYPSELYARELAGWAYHTLDVPNQASGAEKKDRETEYLWCNFRSRCSSKHCKYCNP
jgi:DNA adenine methylase